MSNLIKSARATIGTCDCPCQDSTLERLCDEIERLTAALREICSTEKRFTNHGYNIAMKALENRDD